MLPFAPHAECVKCGCVEAESRWLASQLIFGGRITVPEAIERTCIRCGFVWHQLPKDSK